LSANSTTNGIHMQSIENLLVELGLSINEAKIYQAILKLGSSTAQLISLESHVKRSTVYGCLDTLLDKGLLHIEIKDKRKLFVAEPPKQLQYLLERKQQTLNGLMPLLNQQYLQSPENFNHIKQYQGIKSIKKIYEELLFELAENDEYLVISDQGKWHDLMPDFFEDFILKRAKLDLDIKLILEATAHAKQYQKKQATYNEQIKLLPSNLALNINMIILPHKIIYVQIVEPVLAIVIENPNVVSMNRNVFYMLWEILP